MPGLLQLPNTIWESRSGAPEKIARLQCHLDLQGAAQLLQTRSADGARKHWRALHKGCTSAPAMDSPLRLPSVGNRLSALVLAVD